jgi:uncharacterized protein (DUF2147 family)
MNFSMVAVTLSLASATLFQSPQRAATLTGDWTTPDRSVAKVYSCGTNAVCARLIETPDRTSVDYKNPNVALSKRSLCGIELGGGFSVVDGSHAKNGKLYDPESGKTYSAEMTLDGDALKVRGYVGMSMFGRTEIWHRHRVSLTPCSHE